MQPHSIHLVFAHSEFRSFVFFRALSIPSNFVLSKKKKKLGMDQETFCVCVVNSHYAWNPTLGPLSLFSVFNTNITTAVCINIKVHSFQAY